MMHRHHWHVACVATFAFALAVAAQAPARFDPMKYTARSADIPMRDGVTLHTEILIPAGATAPVPFLFKRTPYGAGNATPQMLTGGYRELAEDGYIFVNQDIRGRYRSGGTFVMQRPIRSADSAATAIDETTDAYDTIEWLLKNIPNNNGRVGMLGVSYDGWTAAMAMLDPHPALKAVSEQASPADMFLGDDFHHNGAFRLSYGFEYAYMTEATRENSEYKFEPKDTYDWYLRVGPLRNIQANIMRDTVLPSWRDFAQHPNYDAFWQRQSMHRSLTRVTVPTLNVAGWWDQEDFYGPVTIYRTLEKQDSLSRNTHRDRALDPRVLGRRFWTPTGCHRFRLEHRSVLPPAGAAAVLRALPEGSRRATGERGAGVRIRKQSVAHVRLLARAGCTDASPLLP